MSLSVRRLRNVFVAGAEMSRLNGACDLLEASVRTSGVESLASALDEALDPADPSVWIIRNLRVSFTVADAHDGAKVWSRGIAAGIQRLIHNGADGHNAIRFPDRASYWAWFLRDLADGSSSRWWYESLESLRYLDFGATCVTLLSRQPELTPSVLGMLMEWGLWPEVIQRISREQAASLMEWITDVGETPSVELLESAAQLWPWASDIAEDDERLCLTLVIRLVRDHPEAAPAAIRGAVRHLEQTRLVLHGLFNQLPIPDGADVREFVRTLLMNLPAPFSMLSQVQLQQLSAETFENLLRCWTDRNAPEEPSEVRTVLTEFGGWFLLLPAYVALDVDAIVEPADRPALRWIIGRSCLGPRGRDAPGDDPGLLWAADLEKQPRPEDIPSPDEETLSRWLLEAGFEEPIDREYFDEEGPEAAWAPVAAAVFRKFAQQLPGFNRSSPAHLAANVLDGRTSLRFTPVTLEISLMRRPLDIVLRMAGIDGLTYLLPWKNHATISIHID